MTGPFGGASPSVARSFAAPVYRDGVGDGVKTVANEFKVSRVASVTDVVKAVVWRA